jgi:hypothetical protein
MVLGCCVAVVGVVESEGAAGFGCTVAGFVVAVAGADFGCDVAGTDFGFEVAEAEGADVEPDGDVEVAGDLELDGAAVVVCSVATGGACAGYTCVG